jgi:hypothetical protein
VPGLQDPIDVIVFGFEFPLGDRHLRDARRRCPEMIKCRATVNNHRPALSTSSSDACCQARTIVSWTMSSAYWWSPPTDRRM